MNRDPIFFLHIGGKHEIFNIYIHSRIDAPSSRLWHKLLGNYRQFKVAINQTVM